MSKESDLAKIGQERVTGSKSLITLFPKLSILLKRELVADKDGINVDVSSGDEFISFEFLAFSKDENQDPIVVDPNKTPLVSISMDLGEIEDKGVRQTISTKDGETKILEEINKEFRNHYNKDWPQNFNFTFFGTNKVLAITADLTNGPTLSEIAKYVEFGIRLFEDIREANSN